MLSKYTETPKEPPPHDTPYTGAKDIHGWRHMVPPPVDPHARKLGPEQRAAEAAGHGMVRVLSYNVLAQRRTKPDVYAYCRLTDLKWVYRRENLLREIFSFPADVLCLQEVDHYRDWWQPQLSDAGFDSVWKQRTRSGVNGDGVLVAWRRDVYQLQRSAAIELNDAAANLAASGDDAAEALAVKCMTDHVALAVQLQPWEFGRCPSGVCVVSAHLAAGSEAAMGDVQLAQAVLLLREVEQFNADFQLPVVVAGTFNFTPDSAAYHVVTTGRVPTPPRPPEQCRRPRATEATKSSARLTWWPPESPDAPIEHYVVERLIGRNTMLGWGEAVVIADPRCTTFVATKLSSGVTYEFRVAAVNAHGRAAWSDASAPVRTSHTILNLPSGRALANPVAAQEEVLSKVIPLGKVFDVADGSSGLTPRDTDGVADRRKARFKTEALYRERAPVGAPAAASGLLPATQEHCGRLASAYRLYGGGGQSEPAFTFRTECHEATLDYIFHSAERLTPRALLATPDDDNCRFHDVRQPEQIPDPARPKPDDWDDRPQVMLADYETGDYLLSDNPEYAGAWDQPLVENENRWHNYLPNARFSSDHTALLASFAMEDDRLVTREL